MLDFCWPAPFYFNMIFADPPSHSPLSLGMHETKSHHVQLIDILFKTTLNLDLSCSSPRPCVDKCCIDIKVLGALNHFFFFSRLFFFRAWNTNLCKDTVFFLWVVFWFTIEWIRRRLIVALPTLLSLNSFSKFLDDTFLIASSFAFFVPYFPRLWWLCIKLF